MSFTKERRETIKKYILEKISESDADIIVKTADVFSTSSNTVYRYLRDLEKDRIIERHGRKYSLSKKEHYYSIELENIPPDSEDIVYSQYMASHINDLPHNVVGMWEYCFTEMINNVIDHSQATNLSLYINRDYLNTAVIIEDNGIGIFHKIQDHYGFESIEDAILELFKGKLTTDHIHHSGEGVFFSSRIMDVFAAISGDKIFSHTEFNEVVDDLNEFPGVKGSDNPGVGTIILMKLSNYSKKTNKEIFDQYANVDGGFTRTSIPIKNIYPAYPVSRSQAKRLTHRFDSFQEVELDFSGVSEIGQGFAHEIFVVFHQQHPEVFLIPSNANADIQRMIYHVTAQK